MRELFDHWCGNENFDVQALPLSRDPFWDPVSTEYLVGSCRVYLEPLAYGCEVAADIRLLGSDGKPAEPLLRVGISRSFPGHCGVSAWRAVSKSRSSRIFYRDPRIRCVSKGRGAASVLQDLLAAQITELKPKTPDASAKAVESMDDLEHQASSLAGQKFEFSVSVPRIRKMPAHWERPRLEFQHYMDEALSFVSKGQKAATYRGEPPEWTFGCTDVVCVQDPVTERYSPRACVWSGSRHSLGDCRGLQIEDGSDVLLPVLRRALSSTAGISTTSRTEP